MCSEKDRYIGYVEMALGLGDMMGPAIGGFVFGILGYVGTFLVFSAIIMTGVIGSFLTIPSKLNKKSVPLKKLNSSRRMTEGGDYSPLDGDRVQSAKNLEKISDTGSSRDFSDSFEYKQLNYLEFFKHPKSILCLLSATFSVIFTLYLDCILALHLHSTYGIEHDQIGMIFFMSSITYVAGAPLSSYLSTFINRRFVAFFAFLFMII